jgi:plastocyanin
LRARIVVAALGVTAFLLPTASLGQAFDVVARGGSDGEWRPATRTITVGDKVIWRNPTSKKHDVKAYRGPWNKYTVLEPGETTQKRFTEAARYKYRCSLHSTFVDGKCIGMCGKIVVEKN